MDQERIDGMTEVLQPGCLTGTIAAIPSKSHAHRLLICAALSDKASQLRCPQLSRDIQATIDKIKSHNIKAGLVIKPNTPAEVVFPYLSQLYMVLVMTVEPGFGGQSFMADMLPKVTAIRKEAERQGISNLLIQVDGGIGEGNIRQAFEAGVDVCVAGTSVFKAEDASLAIKNMKDKCV